MKNQKDQDFSKFIAEEAPSTKEVLLKACQKHNVSIYIDDASETSSGVYAELRAVASEAELERRLNARHSVSMASRANAIAILALLVSVVALVKSFL